MRSRTPGGSEALAPAQGAGCKDISTDTKARGGVSPGLAGSSLPVVLPSPSDDPCPACAARAAPVLSPSPEWPQRGDSQSSDSRSHWEANHHSTAAPAPRARPRSPRCCRPARFPAGSHPQHVLHPVNPGSWLVPPASPPPISAFPLLLAAPFPHSSGHLRTLLDHNPPPWVTFVLVLSMTEMRALPPPPPPTPLSSITFARRQLPGAHHRRLGHCHPLVPRLHRHLRRAPGHRGMDTSVSSSPAPGLIFAARLDQLRPGAAQVWAVLSRRDLRGDLVPPPRDGSGVCCRDAQRHEVTTGRSHPRLPSGHRAGRGHLAWTPFHTQSHHRLPKFGLGDTMSWCDTSRHGLQDPRGKCPPWWATASSVPGPGPGAGATLVRTASPQQASPGTAPGSRTQHRQTDRQQRQHTQTARRHRSPPHPGLTPLTSRLRGGSAPGGC